MNVSGRRSKCATCSNRSEQHLAFESVKEVEGRKRTIQLREETRRTIFGAGRPITCIPLTTWSLKKRVQLHEDQEVGTIPKMQRGSLLRCQIRVASSARLSSLIKHVLFCRY